MPMRLRQAELGFELIEQQVHEHHVLGTLSPW